jgi:hypothetical protein
MDPHVDLNVARIGYFSSNRSIPPMLRTYLENRVGGHHAEEKAS